MAGAACWLPGFPWMSWGGFCVGLLESYGYGWYLALIWMSLYNVFVSRPGPPHASFLLVTVLTALGVSLSLRLPNQLVVRKRTAGDRR